MGAAILAAGLVFAVFVAHPLPRWIARPLGAHEGDFAERGGMVMRWDAPTVDEDQLERIEETLRARTPDGYVQRAANHFEIALPGVAAEDVDFMAKRLTEGEGLTFREALIVPQMQQLVEVEPQMKLEIDQWRPEEGGALETDYFVVGSSTVELDKMFADARAKGWQLPPSTHIAYEQLDGEKFHGYRTYVVRDEPDLDGFAIASAVKSYDPNTARPIVLLDFTRDGARRFGELTERIVGHKLATLVDGRVRSAPIINGPIRGGRASIAMGATDPTKAEAEADDLAQVLKLGALPPGGHVVEKHYVAPSASASRLWLARALLALVAAALAGGLAFLVLRFARPEKQPLAASAGGSAPWTRLAVMLVAPLALWITTHVTIFGVNDVELAFRVGASDVPDTVRIGALGLMPVFTAYVTVELFTLILPTWRRRRNAGPEARQPITLAAAIVTILLIAFQAWNVAQFLSTLDGVLYPGMLGKALVVASLMGGTLILIIAAELIRWKGLGNGYGALFVAGWCYTVFHRFRHDFGSRGDHIVEAVGVAIVLVIFVIALRWRVRGTGEVALRFPSSSIAPLAEGGGVVAVIALLAQLPANNVLMTSMDWVLHLHHHPLAAVGVVGVLAMIWSALLARPAPIGADSRPSLPSWARATILSACVLAFVAAVSGLVSHAIESSYENALAMHFNFVDGVMLAITAAVILDAIEDFRARREKLVVAWTLHQPHHADSVKRMLAADGIRAHMSASHLRSLLSFFGPFVPIEVQVPVEHGEAVREKLERLAAEA